jgi:hypothetical protein
MNAHEDRAPAAVGNRAPRAERDENIAAPRHHRAIPGGAKFGIEPLGHVQGHAFFRQSLARHAAAVMSAVAGVDHDQRSRQSTGSEKTERT